MVRYFARSSCSSICRLFSRLQEKNHNGSCACYVMVHFIVDWLMFGKIISSIVVRNISNFGQTICITSYRENPFKMEMDKN